MTADDGSSRANALLEAIYHSAVDPGDWMLLRDRMLESFRESHSYTPQQQRFGEVVLGHIQRALKLADTHERLRRERHQLERLVDAIAPAICIVDEDGTPVSQNRMAMAMFPQGRAAPNTIDAGSISLSRTTLRAALVTASRQGYACALLGGERTEEALRVHVGLLSGPPEVRLAVVVFPEGRLLEAAVGHFAGTYRLTVKERSVLEQALREPRLEDVAEAEAIGYHTVRQHLRAIYGKTGTSSRTELLAHLMRRVVVQEAVRTASADLLPSALPTAHSRMLEVGGAGTPRRLCYAEYGDPGGTPVLYFHTLTGSRLELTLHHALLCRNGIRLIALDRPGFGGSDYVDYESYEVFTRDVRVLLDRLNVQRVGLLACSAGTPHALSCAARLPERITFVQCVGGVPPIDHILSGSSHAFRSRVQSHMFRVAPRLMRPALELMLHRQTVDSLYGAMLGKPSKLLRFDERDVSFMSHPDHLESFVACSIEAMRQGTKAWAKEGTMANLPWAVPFERTRCPVHFWHGSADDVIPAAMMASFATEFRRHQITVIEGETHLMVHRYLAALLPAFHDHA